MAEISAIRPGQTGIGGERKMTFAAKINRGQF